MGLERFIKIYGDQLPQMLEHHGGKWTVIGESGVVGFYDTPQYAYTQGVGTYGAAEFLLRQVRPEQPAASRSR